MLRILAAQVTDGASSEFGNADWHSCHTIVEPGGFGTDWAGSSMTIGAVGEDYRSTVDFAYAPVAQDVRPKKGTD